MRLIAGLKGREEPLLWVLVGLSLGAMVTLPLFIDWAPPYWVFVATILFLFPGFHREELYTKFRNSKWGKIELGVVAFIGIVVLPISLSADIIRLPYFSATHVSLGHSPAWWVIVAALCLIVLWVVQHSRQIKPGLSTSAHTWQKMLSEPFSAISQYWGWVILLLIGTPLWGIAIFLLLQTLRNQTVAQAASGTASSTATPKPWWAYKALPILLVGLGLLAFAWSEAKPKHMLWQLGIAPIPDMVEIPAGHFQMGGESGDIDEKTGHTVTFKHAFEMSSHEVTFNEYDYYVWRMQNAGIEVESPNDEGWGRGNRPVINVFWHDAQGYVNWLSKEKGTRCRLPSEAEWEYAARAPMRMADSGKLAQAPSDYFWGNDIGENNANCYGCGSQWDNKQTAPVGSFPANDWGLHDMHGNVWEWTQDCWAGDFTTAPIHAPINGKAWETSDNTEGNCSRRVVRGGGWYDGPGNLRSALRNSFNPVSRYNLIGFRVVCTLPSAER